MTPRMANRMTDAAHRPDVPKHQRRMRSVDLIDALGMTRRMVNPMKRGCVR